MADAPQEPLEYPVPIGCPVSDPCIVALPLGGVPGAPLWVPCRLHGAAPGLRDALRAMVDAYESDLSEGRLPRRSAFFGADGGPPGQARAALKKAGVR